MMTWKFDIHPAQTVYLRPTGNYAYNWDGKPIEAKVLRIARQYFYVEINAYRTTRFRRDDFSCADLGDCNAGYEIFPSLEAFQRIVEYECKLQSLRRIFNDWRSNLDYDTVVSVYELLESRGYTQIEIGGKKYNA